MNGTASTAPEPEAAPEPVAPELIVGRRYRVGPNPTFRIDGNEFEIDVAATVTLASAIPDADGDVLIDDHDHDGIVSIDPRHLTPLPEHDAQVAELARVVASLTAKVDVLAEQRDHLNRHIDRLAARLNQLESDAAKPSPLHQAIAEEIRRAAGAR